MAAAYGTPGRDFALGVEEELLVVDPQTLALSHTARDVLDRLERPPGGGSAHPDTYTALVELASPVTAGAGEAVAALDGLRAAARAAGATLLGAGIHPDGAFGDVAHIPEPRYEKIVAQLRGLAGRTPTCALHVHVGMPDAETAIRVYNGLREHLPLLQALAASSPFWHGRDSGLASARAQIFRSYPRGEVPPAFASYAEYEALVDAITTAGALPDYTYLWWDVRPHPNLGTVELRAMDAQSALWSVAALAALVHGLASAAADDDGRAAPSPREALSESSYRAARDGLDATLWHDGALRPVAEVARAAVARARPHAREHGADAALDLVERILTEGGGAARQRRAHAEGGMPALLRLLADETAAPFSESSTGS